MGLIHSEELVDVRLLSPHKWSRNPLKVTTCALYAIVFLVVILSGARAAMLYDSLPAANKALEYPLRKLNLFEEMKIAPPPLSPTILNGLLYHDVGIHFRVVLFLLLVPIAVHIITILIEFWVVEVRAVMSFSPVKNPRDASVIFATPRCGSGQPCFLTMHHEVQHTGKSPAATSPEDFSYVSYFYFQQIKYVWIDKENKFISVSDDLSSQQTSLGVLLRSADKGLSSAEHSQATILYGENRLAVPLLTLGHLFVEHILSPFFMFQLFTSILWLFDDFAVYSFFTSIMLLFMEGGNILTKFNRMKESRQMISNPCQVEVRRDCEWVVASSTSLVPGDLVRFTVDNLQAAMERQSSQAEKQRKSAQDTQLKQLGVPSIHILLSRMGRMFLSGSYPAENYTIVQREKNIGFSTQIPADLLITKNVAVVDESLLTGESAVQMKDSIWESDLLLNKTLDDAKEIPFNQDRDAPHILYAGTTLVSVSSEPVEAVVLRTGFEMSQGQLIRKILFDTERTSSTTKDAVQFLVIMFVIACIASIYTFVRGYVTQICPLNRLILESLIVFVSVIPPELPMEVSMTVSASLQELRRLFIYCTEPFKIMNAGKLRICCFDKTGTLCDCEVKVVGFISNSEDDRANHLERIISSVELVKRANRSLENGSFTGDLVSHLVLSSAQSLFVHHDKLIGDPLEQAIYADSKIYSIQTDGVVSLALTHPWQVTVTRRFALSNRLKRMSVVATATCNSKAISKTIVATKGAPEVIKELCTPQSVPYWHDDCLNKLAAQGYRILSFAYRELESSDETLTRANAEDSLTFLGFIVTDSNLKPDTREAIEIIKASGHRCAVISGDNVISVGIVSIRSGILPASRPLYNLEKFDECAQTCLFTRLTIRTHHSAPTEFDFPSELEVTEKNVKAIARQYSLAVTNNPAFIALLAHSKCGPMFIPRIHVFARMTPEQKADIIRVMQGTAPTLFCGDGSNDVEGLRSADVGVALWEATDYKEKKAEADRIEASAKESAIVRQQRIQAAVAQIPKPSILGPSGTPASQQLIYTEARRRSAEKNTKLTDEMRYLIWEQNKYWSEVRRVSRSGSTSLVDKIFGMSNDGIMSGWSQAFDIEDEGKSLQLGDAAIAAPFTAKSGTIGGVLDIIRQGRCSLVTLIMTYKTLALKCIVGAYSMSVLTLDGVRYSEQQLMASGVSQMFILFNINKSKPLRRISRIPAPDNIISAYALVSLALQVLVHVLIMSLLVHLLSTEKTTVPFDVKFQPSLVNTVVFLLGMYQDLAINVVNYPGEPYMLGLTQFKKLWRGVIVSVVATLVLTMQWLPELNEALGLITMDGHVQRTVMTFGLLDVLLCLGIERASFHILGPKPISDDA
ncbi:Calcium-transporting ATPase [Giardia duodenalis]|uniref:Calcium-transporting ATPase n=1 Tax=Giardia intestinalis TaxID=5741 RepID=V6TR17_GIAIN|nr:Calcium-transporting ATPase [Giardia intestinalis]